MSSEDWGHEDCEVCEDAKERLLKAALAMREALEKIALSREIWTAYSDETLLAAAIGRAKEALAHADGEDGR